MQEVDQVASQLAHALAEAGQRIVLAESCTAGLASAMLAQVPGVSQWHCGSAVTYRERSKIDWLGVSQRDIVASGVVSEPVARQMAYGVLRRTVEANIGAAITGHLGPQAPAELDGVVFVAVAERGTDETFRARVSRYQLVQLERRERQVEAACLLLECVVQRLRCP